MIALHTIKLLTLYSIECIISIERDEMSTSQKNVKEYSK